LTHNGQRPNRNPACTNPDLVAALRYTASLPNAGDLAELDQLKRRGFITLLVGAVAWPIAARAQQRLPVIGYLGARSRDLDLPFIAAFIRGLNETGYTEGRNVTIEYRWADSHADRLPTLATELVQRRVDLIFSSSSGSAVAAKAATKIIPIVFTGGVRSGTSWFGC